MNSWSAWFNLDLADARHGREDRWLGLDSGLATSAHDQDNAAGAHMTAAGASWHTPTPTMPKACQSNVRERSVQKKKSNEREDGKKDARLTY